MLLLLLASCRPGCSMRCRCFVVATVSLIILLSTAATETTRTCCAHALAPTIFNLRACYTGSFSVNYQPPKRARLQLHLQQQPALNPSLSLTRSYYIPIDKKCSPKFSIQKNIFRKSKTRSIVRKQTSLNSLDDYDDNRDQDAEDEVVEPTEIKNDTIFSTIQSAIASNTLQSTLFSLYMILAGALLGPFLDSYHSAFGVLQYNTPITVQLWSTNTMQPALITSWWVPPLFGLAGLIIGWLYILFDTILMVQSSSTISTIEKHRFQHRFHFNSVTPPRILLGISLFTFQYWLSGVLYATDMVDRTGIFYIMSIVAAIGFVVLDNTKSGFITSAATAIGGPLVEVGLISYFTTTSSTYGYHYTDSGETGFFPLWIMPVYFLGGPAVGNLARGIWNGLSFQANNNASSKNVIRNNPELSSSSGSTKPGCKECNDTRIVPCPSWYVIS